MISIHAPLTGRDALTSVLNSVLTTFQSTRPLRGATIGNALTKRIFNISIHAPLTGRDSKNAQIVFCIFAITDNKSGKVIM